MREGAADSGDFSAQAEAYARSRPDYPREWVRGLAARAGVSSGERVCDIGAGTGAMTRVLAQLGHPVLALEPNGEMAQRAPELDGVEWRVATFEETGLGDASQRWIVIAQAFHWADPPRALPELHRVLRAGGVLTILWNVRQNERDPVLARTWSRLREYVPGFEDCYRERDWGEVLASTGHFTAVEYDEHEHAVTMERERFVDLWRSHHRFQVAAGAEKANEFVRELDLELRREGVASVDVPYACVSWSARAERALA